MLSSLNRNALHPEPRTKATNPFLNVSLAQKRFFRSFFLLAFLFLGANVGFAQVENCSNGIDDDGDGLVDFYDVLDCPCDTFACGMPFYNNCPPACQFVPPPGNFSMTQAWSYPGANVSIVPIVADVDGDCIPEVLTYRNNIGVDILNSTNGTLLYALPITLNPQSSIATGNVDNDPEAEVFVTAQAANSLWYFYRFDFNGATMQQTWQSNVAIADRRYGPSLADFNHDGISEVYTGNQIFNALTGVELANGGAGSTGWYTIGSSNFMISTSVAADVLPNTQCTDCGGLELVAGNMVYTVNITNTSGSAGNTMTSQVVFAPERDGATRIVDFDLDGDLDGVITTQTSATGGSRIYIWDLQTTAQLGMTYLPPNVANNQRIGPSSIADVDNDGWPEIIVCTANRLNLLHDWNTASSGGGWGSSMASTQAQTLNIVDQSGATGATVFDLNGDGAVEILYRDEQLLRVMDANFTVLGSIACLSGTATEYPVVADIDGDGETEFLVTCSTGLTAFQSLNLPWVRTRTVWNQYNYFVVNVNDDYGIPVQQQQHHLVGNGVIMNNFLVQQAILDANGNPTFLAADATLDLQSTLCDPSGVTITFEVCNLGDNLLPTGTPITFYDSDPTSTTANIIGTTTLTGNLTQNQCIVQTIFIAGLTSGTVFAVVNDNGSLPGPYSLATDFPVTGIGECDYTNNLDDIVLSCLCDGTNLMANFTFVVNGGVVTVTDLSTGNPLSYITIDYGDGTVMNAAGGSVNSHPYTQSGTYTLCVKATSVLNADVCCHDSLCAEVTVEVDPCEYFRANFTHSIISNTSTPTVEFTDATQPDSDVSLWDFGDGFTHVGNGSGTTVQHTFPNQKVRKVQLISIKHINDSVCCIDTICIEIGFFDDRETLRQVYPTVVKDVITIEYQGPGPGQPPVDLWLMDMKGDIIQSKKGNAEGSSTFDVSKLEQGMYFIRLRSDEMQEQKKFMKY